MAETAAMVKAVKPKDRIKYWNIVPGDQIRIRGDPLKTVHEVHQVNKLFNRVLLKTERDTVVRSYVAFTRKSFMNALFRTTHTRLCHPNLSHIQNASYSLVISNFRPRANLTSLLSSRTCVGMST